MAARKTTPKKAVQAPVAEAPAAPELCGAFAYILGATLGAFCRLAPGHEGPHRTEIKVFAEPQAHFVITWVLGQPAE